MRFYEDTEYRRAFENTARLFNLCLSDMNEDHNESVRLEYETGLSLVLRQAQEGLWELYNKMCPRQRLHEAAAPSIPQDTEIKEMLIPREYLGKAIFLSCECESEGGKMAFCWTEIPCFCTCKICGLIHHLRWED